MELHIIEFRGQGWATLLYSTCFEIPDLTLLIATTNGLIALASTLPRCPRLCFVYEQLQQYKLIEDVNICYAHHSVTTINNIPTAVDSYR